MDYYNTIFDNAIAVANARAAERLPRDLWLRRTSTQITSTEALYLYKLAKQREDYGPVSLPPFVEQSVPRFSPDMGDAA